MSLFYLLLLGMAVVTGSKAEEITSEQACAMDVDRGECTQDYLAWYYDTDLGRCAQFSYSGCGGNRNRFEYRESCESACIEGDDLRSTFDPQLPPDCRMPIMDGYPGGGCAKVTKFGYNHETQKCMEFEANDCSNQDPYGYGDEMMRFGRGRWGNQFDDEASCIAECVDGLPKPPETPAPEDPNKIPTFCMSQPYRQQYCNDEVHGDQYYYDRNLMACVKYHRLACPNENNIFDYLEDCTRVCKTVAYDPSDVGRRQETNRRNRDRHFERERDWERSRHFGNDFEW